MVIVALYLTNIHREGTALSSFLCFLGRKFSTYEHFTQLNVEANSSDVKFQGKLSRLFQEKVQWEFYGLRGEEWPVWKVPFFRSQGTPKGPSENLKCNTSRTQHLPSSSGYWTNSSTWLIDGIIEVLSSLSTTIQTVSLWQDVTGKAKLWNVEEFFKINSINFNSRLRRCYVD